MKYSLRILLLFFSLVLSHVTFADSVDINSADAKTIAANVKGIGLIKATAIVNYREKNGAFKSIDELVRVKGIGPKIIEQNYQTLVVVSQE